MGVLQVAEAGESRRIGRPRSGVVNHTQSINHGNEVHVHRTMMSHTCVSLSNQEGVSGALGVQAGELHVCSVRERWPHDEGLAAVLQVTAGRVGDRLFCRSRLGRRVLEGIELQLSEEREPQAAVKTPEQVSRARELLRLRILWIQVTVVSRLAASRHSIMFIGNCR